KRRGPHMSRIDDTWTRFPGAPIAQADLTALLPRWVDGDQLRVANQVFRRAAVDTRHMILEPEELLVCGRTFAARNALYRRAARAEVGGLMARVGADVPRGALEEIDLVVTASCTGLQIPALDAVVISSLELPLSLRRLNLTEHGCAAGAASLGI